MAVTTTSRPRARATATVVATLCTSGTVVAVQQTLVVPLLPDFPRILDTTVDNASWLVTATLLTGAVATPIVSRLADMFGKRRMMVLCIGVMVAGSVVGGLAPDLALVVTGRALQGFGLALIPVGISILRDELPRERVAGAVALMSATLGIGAAIGPPLAGVIYDHLDWHAIFWTSAGTGAAILVVVLLVVPESPIRTRGRFDYAGAALLSAALTCLLLAITKGGHWGWTSERVLLLLLIAVVVLAAWVPFELRAGQPLVDIRTSTSRPVLLTNLASLFVGFAMYANMLTTTQQLQLPAASGHGFGASAALAGLCMLPAGLSMVAMAPVSAAITRRSGARTALAGGVLIMAAGYVGRIFLTHTIWQIVVGTTIVAIGTSIGYAAMPILIMGAVPITETASANGLNTLLRAIGTSVSSATVGVVLASTTVVVGGLALPSLDAFLHIFWLAAGASLAALVLALALPRRPEKPAEPTPGSARIRGDEEELVVSGVVASDDERPIAGAVVTVLRPDGEPVDWSRCDHDGAYSLVLPGSGRYVVVSSADGWTPRSEIVEFDHAATQRRIRLADRLSLCGTVRSASAPLGRALVSLTTSSGQAVAAVHTDAGGRYAIPLPATGRYVMTVVDPDVRWAHAQQIVVIATQSATIDIDVAAGTDGSSGAR